MNYANRTTPRVPGARLRSSLTRGLHVATFTNKRVNHNRALPNPADHDRIQIEFREVVAASSQFRHPDEQLNEGIHVFCLTAVALEQPADPQS